MECTVCANKFNNTNFAPRSLKCGHSICHSCLCLVHKDLKFHYTCDTCGETYPCTIADCPLNFALMDMITPESETSSEKCCSHDGKFAKLYKRCKTPDCDNKQTSNLLCEDCSLKGCLRNGFDVRKISYLTHLANAYKEKKRRLENMITISNVDESAFMKCIQDDRLFLKHCLKDVESFLAKLDSLVIKKEFTSVAEYTNYEKELEQFAKFDANVENICNTGWHPSSNVLFENLRIINRVMRDKLKRNEKAYFSFGDDDYHRIVKKGHTFRVNLDETIHSSKLPTNSLLFKGNRRSCYTFFIKFGNGGSEVRLNVDLDLRNIENKPRQELINCLKGGRILNQIRFQMCQNVLYLGPFKFQPVWSPTDYGEFDSEREIRDSSCILTTSNRERYSEDLLDANINRLGNVDMELRSVDWQRRQSEIAEMERQQRGWTAETQEPGMAIEKEKETAIDKSKLAILAYCNLKTGIHEFYFMKCGIGLIGEGVTLIGYHDMEMKDVDCNNVWSTELEFF